MTTKKLWLQQQQKIDGSVGYIVWSVIKWIFSKNNRGILKCIKFKEIKEEYLDIIKIIKLDI